MTITFFVPGLPRPSGSKKSFVPIDKRTGQPFRAKATGRIVVNTVDDSKHGKEWKSIVSMVALSVRPVPALTGPLSVSMTFYMPRIKAHFHTSKAKAGQLRDDAPEYHTSKPDTTKLIRGTEDALTSIIWQDDAQIAAQKAWKLYEDGRGVGCEITITRLEESGR